MGFCATHYASHRFRGEVCSVDGCDTHPRAAGLCTRHYNTARGACTVEGCDKPLRAKGYCVPHYNEYSGLTRECPECGEVFAGHAKRRYCSVWCKAQANRSPVRKAVEAGDRAGIILAAESCSVKTSSGCWEWQFAKTVAGYPMIGQGGSGGLVHRHVAAAVAGRDIGSEPVHHKCANPSCVNPEHLQLTTHRENLAEMLQRTFYVRRIAELEAALMELAPDHPAVTGG